MPPVPTPRQCGTADPACAEPLLAGTLCLMSAIRQTGCPQMAHKVAQNLASLARRPELSAEFRRVCDRLEATWLDAAASLAAARASGRGDSPAPGIIH